MSSVASIASAAALSSQSQVRTSIATEIVKMNADAAAAMASLLEAASENLEAIVKAPVPAGVGGTVDISA